jgi:hypothetical protein
MWQRNIKFNIPSIILNYTPRPRVSAEGIERKLIGPNLLGLLHITIQQLTQNSTPINKVSVSRPFCKNTPALSHRRLPCRRLRTRRGRPVPKGRADAREPVVHLFVSHRRRGLDPRRPRASSSPAKSPTLCERTEE